MAPTLGDNDFGQNAFSPMSEASVHSLNYFTFMHGHDLVNNENAFHKVYNLTGYGIEVYSINSGYYGFFQKNEMLEWLIKTMKTDQKSFKIAFYHNPMFAGCPFYKTTVEDLNYESSVLRMNQPFTNIIELTKIFSSLGVKIAFEHHEHLYKISKPMNNLLPAMKNQNSTIYVGGGQWGTPHSE